MNVSRRHLIALIASSLLLLAIGCSDRDTSELARARATIDPVVFADAYSADVYFQAFSGTHYEAVKVDSVWAYAGFAPDGARSLKINIPARDSALGAYSGGVLTSAGPRDLADFNALTFYARSSEPTVLDLAGLGNDNTGNSLYEAGRGNISLGHDWTFVVIPIPAPSKLIAERGLFTFAEAWEDSFATARDIWLDEIKYAKLSNFEVFRSSLNARPGLVPYFIGSTVTLGQATTIYTMDGGLVPINHSPLYFDLESSEPSVANITQDGIKIVGAGTTTITATLEGDITVNGSISLSGHQPPTAAAPTPTVPAGDVISLFSDAYQGINIDTWNAPWGMPVQVADYMVDGNATKMYTTLQWAGIIINSPMVNISAMTHFHVDVYAPSGTDFRVKFVSFPSDGPKAQVELAFDATTTPAFSAGAWSSLEIPLADFPYPAGWDPTNIGEFVISTSDASLLLVDNLYFHK